MGDIPKQGTRNGVKRPRRSSLAREHQRTLVSEGVLRGESQRALAKRLGVSQSTVKRDVRAVREEWRQARLTNQDELVEQELAFVRVIQREAFEQWQKSKESVQKRSSKSRGLANVPKKVGERVQPAEMLLVESSLKEEGRVGDFHFLEVLGWCSTQRCKLLGLFAPVKVAPTTPAGDELYADPRERLLAVLEQKIAHLGTPLPEGIIGAGEQPALAPAPVEVVEQADGSFSVDDTGSTGPVEVEVPEGFRLR